MNEFDAIGKLVSTMFIKLPINLAFSARSDVYNLLIKYKLKTVKLSGVFKCSQTLVIYNQQVTNKINMNYSLGYNRTLTVQTNNPQVLSKCNGSSAYSSNDDIFCTQQLFYLINTF